MKRFVRFGLLLVVALFAGSHALSQSPETPVGKIVFTTVRNQRPRLGIINSDGSEEGLVFKLDDYQYEQAEWSPDGQSLIYQRISRSGMEGYLGVTNLESGATTVISELGGLHPRFSSSGDYVVFFRPPDLSTRQDNIFKFSFLNNQISNLTPGIEGIYPSISPDEQKIVFQSRDDEGGNISIVNADGLDLQVLFKRSGFETMPQWSSDGRWVSFLNSSRQPEPGLYLYELETGTIVRVTDQPVRPNYAWSSDGLWIAYSIDNTNDPKNGQLHIVNINDLIPQQLTDFPNAISHSPSWSPDGRKIAFASNRDGDDFEIYVIDVATKEALQLTDNVQQDISPIWSPR